MSYNPAEYHLANLLALSQPCPFPLQPDVSVVNPWIVDLDSDITALFGTICGEGESETIAGKRAVAASIMGEVLRIALGFPRLNFAL